MLHRCHRSSDKENDKNKIKICFIIGRKEYLQEVGT